MAIQFPDTPLIGDPPVLLSNGVNYIWDGEKWSSYGGSSGGGGGSSTINSGQYPPAGPSDGDLWFDTDKGILYVFYDDGNSGQWVDSSAKAPVVVDNGGGDTGIEEAPEDGKQYGREDGGWTETDDIPSLPQLPS